MSNLSEEEKTNAKMKNAEGNKVVVRNLVRLFQNKFVFKIFFSHFIFFFIAPC